MVADDRNNAPALDAQDASSSSNLPGASGGANTSADISMDDADTSATSLAQRVLVRNAEGEAAAAAASSSAKAMGGGGPSANGGAAAAAAVAGSRRVSSRNSPAPRRPGAVAWKDLTASFRLGPGASVQSAPAPNVTTAAGPVMTTVVAPAAASALDSFASARAPRAENPNTTTTSSSSSSSVTATDGTSTQARTASRTGTGATGGNSGSSLNAPVASAAMARTASNSSSTTDALPNGHAPVAPLHPNAAFATEVLGPPPRLPLDPYYPPLATTYTGVAPPGSQASIAKVANQHMPSAPQATTATTAAAPASTDPATASTTNTPDVAMPSTSAATATAPQPPAATSSSSRSKKPLLTINHGTEVGYGAGPAVLPSAVAQALGTVASKKRNKLSFKALAASTAPRTTRARSLHDTASASPSPSMPTVGLAPVSIAGMPLAADVGGEAVIAPLSASSGSLPFGRAAFLGLDVTGADSGSDTDSVRNAAGSSSTPAATDIAAPPELKKRKLTAKLSRSGTRTSSPASQEPATSTMANAAAAPASNPSSTTTVADDLDAIFAVKRARRTAPLQDPVIPQSQRAASELSSAETSSSGSALSSAPSSQNTMATTGGTSGAPPADQLLPPSSSSATSSGAPAVTPTGTPVKRPRITVKRNGVVAPIPPSVAAAAAAASQTTNSSAEPISQAQASVSGTPPAGPALPDFVAAHAAAPLSRVQTPPLRSGSPAGSTRARRSVGVPTFGPTTVATGSKASLSSAFGAGAMSTALGVMESMGSAGPSSSAMVARPGTPTRPMAPTLGALAYPTIGAAAHMSGSPQKVAETVSMGMTANGTLGIAPAAEFAAAAAAGGHISAVQGPAPALGRSAMLAAPPGEKQSNQDFCDACKGHGRFLCCDGCIRSFHFSCISPPVDFDEIAKMEDSWFCNVCTSTKLPPRKEPKGIFPRLTRQLEQTNPVQYELPADIRNYFKGVGTALDGSYLNVGMIKPLRVNKQGLIEDRDPYKLKDKNGKAVLCYHCGGSALPAISHSGDLVKTTMVKYAPSSSISKSASVQPPIPTPDGNWRRILSCDFCLSHWHLDCVTPPLAVMPNMTRKWMCPNHAEHSMPKIRIPKTSSAIQPYALPLPTAENIGKGKLYKVRLRNNGDVDIIPDPTDSFFNTDGSTNSATQSGWEEVIIGGANPNGSGQRFRYRVPEKVVRLDFWNRVRANVEPMAVRFGKPSRDTDPVLTLDDLADVAMERLRRERVLEKVETSGTETDRRTVLLVSKVFKAGRDDVQDFPPVRSQRQFEEAIERARVHGVIGLEGGVLLSRLSDAPTVSERSTVGMVDEDPKKMAAMAIASIKVEETGSALDDGDTRMNETPGTEDNTPDPTRLAPPTSLKVARFVDDDGGRGRGRVLGDGGAPDGSGSASEGPSSPASTLTDLSSDDGMSSDDGRASAGPSSWRQGNKGNTSSGRSGSSSSSGTAGLLETYGLKEADVERLLAVEQLIKVKGEAALLEFLLEKGESS
ncbi:unnamed protein product [Tilletia laevis]|uniref:PHD-type domain-containing protein n=3 Tax=Tilletia TaxID=13289 RepID=A0A8X7SY86_9BASI|nr:hypothetical protein CF328_g2446 [Tilletia controversa]KAE8206569.1 hypothetical protein CF335_g1789 [Tilletia laevis]KAE8261046.1 hypothetical protein A4X03_0g3586 [Tilletia caries]KAE8251590.1 hypothetical protein A4X06_0g2618 [Tilletia controversa]CAD6907680.1 unnamed protein product [Tilletia caries]